MKSELNEAIRKAYCEYLDERGINFYSQYYVDYLESNLKRMFILCTRGTQFDLLQFEDCLITWNNHLINDK